MKEIWKDIEGYEGCYQVSNFGRVKSLMYGKEKILKLEKTNKCYFRVALCKNGKVKRYFVHILVCKAFLPNPDNLPFVNHKDENQSNNFANNLEWCDRKYNNNYGNHNKKVSESLINHPKFSKKLLCIETGVVYQSTHQAERDLGLSRGCVSKACRGIYKKVSGFHWRYTE